MSDDRPVLEPVTDMARVALQRDTVPLHTLPFRVGRESRFGVVDGHLKSLERRSSDAPTNNDLYLIDQHKLLNISREHFQIEKRPDGGYVLVDRGSTCGTFVDGQAIGGDTGKREHPLKDGSTITVGISESPFVFRFFECARSA